MAPEAGITPLLSPSSTVPLLALVTSGVPTPDLVFVPPSDPVYSMAVKVTNATSIAACLLFVIAFFVLRQKHSRLMKRTSLKLSLAMNCTDLFYHCSNLAGYGQLQDGFVCAFVGGWLFAFGSMLSLFYAAAIALNTQLVIVHDRTPQDNKQIYFLLVPVIVAFTICTPALIAGVYGYDEMFKYCWYETRGLDNRTIILRMVLTYNLWLCLTLLYVVVAAILITWSFFNPSHRLGGNPIPVSAAHAATLALRDTARRALTVRLLGYILVPTICVISGMVVDLLGGSKSRAHIPREVEITVSALAGLMGTMNAILFAFDPSVRAVIKALRDRRAQQQIVWAYINEILVTYGGM